MIWVAILIAILNIDIQVSPARADTPAALSAITDTAEKICGIWAAQGEIRSTKATGEVHAELSGLAKRLASIGVSGAGDIASSSYQGVLQSDLSSTLKDIRDCRLKVFENLRATALRETAQLSRPDASAVMVSPTQQECIELAEQVRTRSVKTPMGYDYGEDVARRTVEAMRELGCVSMKR